ARAGRPRALRRHRRLLRAQRQHGPGDHDPHPGRERRRVQLPGGRRDRRGQRAGAGAPGGTREERDPAPRARARKGGVMSARVLLIDNYDSFTYNLVQAFLVLEAEVLVYRNDALGVADALALDPTHLVISPGPGRPDDAGSSLAMIEAF